MSNDADVVYPLRLQPRYEEVRYSLRSLTNLPHRGVWIVGGRPPWLSSEAGHIPTHQDQGKYHNVILNILAAIDNPDVSDPFWLFNDDFFITEPLPDGVPVWNLGPVGKVLAGYKNRRDDNYVARVRATANALGPDALSYEGHWPMLVAKEPLREALNFSSGHEPPLQWRTVYGNRMSLGGTQRRDCKVKVISGRLLRPVVSTSDRSFADYHVGQQIRAMFPNRSRYEEQT